MNSALGTMTNGEFNLYSVLLAVSGILLIVTAATGFGSRTTGARALSGIFGLVFLGYAFYLQFIFTGGSVFLSYYVFAVPVLLIVTAFRERKARAERAAAATRAASMPGADRTV